jgi:hypothetical protein
MIVLIRSCWAVFGPLLADEHGPSESTSEWLDRFKDLRDRTAHSIKLRSIPFQTHDLEFLRARAARLEQVHRQLQASHPQD